MNYSLKISGKSTNFPNELKKSLEKKLIKGIQDSIKKDIGSVQCPEHRKPPNLVYKGDSLDKLSIEVSGCCDKLIEAVQKKLK